MAKTKMGKISDKERTIALVLAIIGFFGIAGIHRFYAGKFWTGLIWLLTGGVFYIGTIIDVINIANGTFQDKNGGYLKK